MNQSRVRSNAESQEQSHSVWSICWHKHACRVPRRGPCVHMLPYMCMWMHAQSLHEHISENTIPRDYCIYECPGLYEPGQFSSSDSCYWRNKNKALSFIVNLYPMGHWHAEYVILLSLFFLWPDWELVRTRCPQWCSNLPVLRPAWHLATSHSPRNAITLTEMQPILQGPE